MLKIVSGDIIENAQKYNVEAIVNPNNKYMDYGCGVCGAIYDAAGLITGYECIEYPNCEGDPIALESEDNVFRAPEYTINSAPKTGEPPYKITYVDVLPAVE